MIAPSRQAAAPRRLRRALLRQQRAQAVRLGARRLLRRLMLRQPGSGSLCSLARCPKLRQPVGGRRLLNHMLYLKLRQPGGGSRLSSRALCLKLRQPGGGILLLSRVLVLKLRQPGVGSLCSRELYPKLRLQGVGGHLRSLALRVIPRK